MLEARWKKARRVLAIATVLALVGVTAYLAAASDQRTVDAKPHALIPDREDTRDLILDFVAGALGSKVPEDCAGRRRGVQIPGKGGEPLLLVLRPKNACPGLLARVKPEEVKRRPARVRSKTT